MASRSSIAVKTEKGSAVHPLLQSHPEWVAHSMLPDAEVLISEDGALAFRDVVRERSHSVRTKEGEVEAMSVVGNG